MKERSRGCADKLPLVGHLISSLREDLIRDYSHADQGLGRQNETTRRTSFLFKHLFGKDIDSEISDLLKEQRKLREAHKRGESID